MEKQLPSILNEPIVSEYLQALLSSGQKKEQHETKRTNRESQYDAYEWEK